MKTRWIAVLLGIFFVIGVVGCGGGYYQVTDPTSGSVYYTTKVDKERSSAVNFTDEKTGSEVTLQSSEIKKISKKEYKAALEGDKM